MLISTGKNTGLRQILLALIDFIKNQTSNSFKDLELDRIVRTEVQLNAVLKRKKVHLFIGACDTNFQEVSFHEVSSLQFEIICNLGT